MFNPDAPAACETELATRPEVQRVSGSDILAYVLAETLLPEVSAKPFAAWLEQPTVWDDFRESAEEMTNLEVVEVALEEWCGLGLRR